MGYSKSNSKEFYDNLAEAIDKKIPSKVTRTQYGIVCEFREKIKGVNGKYEYANIIASIQKDDGKEKYRILTVYPGKKEKKYAQFKKIVALSNLIQRIYHNDIRNMLP